MARYEARVWRVARRRIERELDGETDVVRAVIYADHLPAADPPRKSDDLAT